MNLGKKIIEIRKNNNMSQEDFAEKFKVTRQTISSWENAKSYPDIETVIRISDAFDISLDVLLKGDKELVKTWDKKMILNKRIIVIMSLIVVLYVLISILLFLVRGPYVLKNTSFSQHYLTCTKNDVDVVFSIADNQDEEKGFSFGWSGNGYTKNIMQDFYLKEINSEKDIESYFNDIGGDCVEGNTLIDFIY